MGTGTDADKFEKFYNAVIRKIKAANAKVILCTPATIGERNDYSNQQDGDLNKYSGIIRKIAAEQQTPLIDLRKSFTDYEKEHNPRNIDRGVLTVDGVHLNAEGNRFVAGMMVDAIRRLP
jgi:lysophospholipase L1-like esterase